MVRLLGTVGTIEKLWSDGDISVKEKCWNPRLLERTTLRQISSTSSVASSKPTTGGRPTKGDKVVLAPDFEIYGDASNGPLKPGDVGDVFEDDKSSMPCHVRFEGRQYWYKREALRVFKPASTSDSSKAASSHRGEWRGSSTRKWCSREEDEEGMHCAHGEVVIQEHHWSCCGITDEAAKYCIKIGDQVKRGPDWKVFFL